MSLFITQCPHCQTSFRTSVSQLQSADGMVRCGACLRVFAADDNLLPAADLRTIHVPVPDEIEDDEEEEFEQHEELDEQLPISELDIEEENTQDDEDSDSIFTLDMADSVPNRLSPRISTNEPFWQLIDDQDTDTVEIEPEDAPTDIDDIVTALPDEEAMEFAQDKEEPPFEEAEANLEPIDDVDAAPTDTAESRDDAQIRSRMTAIDFDDDILNDDSGASKFRHFSAEEIEGVRETETPLELSWLEQPARKRSQTALIILASLLTLGIAAQFLWFNKESMSQYPRWRPLLDGLCSVLKCDLPPLVDIRAIHSDTLVVRSHDEIANALSVNFQFRNDAVYAQPFPGLSLRFTDADDTLVAERRFEPLEYLPEGLAQLGLMPSGSPVQVNLEILDPGAKAINYEVSFYASEPKKLP